jgi:hypothetical protein
MRVPEQKRLRYAEEWNANNLPRTEFVERVKSDRKRAVETEAAAKRRREHR